MTKGVMAKATREAVDRLHKDFEGAEFSYKELAKISEVSIDTLIRHGAVKRVEIEHLERVSVNELVKKLNECAGRDCWGAHWEYRVSMGVPCEVTREVKYIVM